MKKLNKGLVTITLNDDYVVRIELEDGKIHATVSGELDESGVMLSSLVVESIKALQKGLSLNRYFNPNIRIHDEPDDNETGTYMKLMWTKRGQLRIVGMSDKRYQHATNAEEALERKRTFTCDLETLSIIPPSR